MSHANITDMPDATDRDLLEQIARDARETCGMVHELLTELESFRPLLAMIKGGNGKPDMVGVLQARRELRKAGRHGP